MRLVILVSALLVAGGCRGATGPTGPALPGPGSGTTASSPIAALAGHYDVSIDIPQRCAQAASIPTTLSYRATLTPSSHGYLAMSIGPVFRGELWPRGTDTVRFSLNNFDIGGCDGDAETLPDGLLLNICGSGPMTLEGSTIAGTVDGGTWIGNPVAPGTSCSGPHGYRFTRR
jgi:hypothetical protein